MNPAADSFDTSLETHCQDCPTDPETFHPGKEIARRIIQGNVFYIFSAFLMMLGCFLLMPTSSIEEAEQFTRRLRSLLILEGYQFLVIVTAVVIVRRLRILSDAATLLLIATTLLLDPTFFSNAFLTLRTPESLATNIGCLLLVPAKLSILQWGLRIRLTARALLSMGLAGGLVYFGPAVFNL
ncbi:MAG: hypothetical protein KC931_11305, partial [Candidatus Omnitrophica bacterium]|nr:hypothetical protein [Candidatus Omnitrophota bacterium]